VRHILPVKLLLASTLIVGAASEHAVTYRRYESYFEKNNSGLKGENSWLAIRNQEEFDRIFGPAATMGKNSFLPAGTFPGKLVVAAIRRGNFLRSYEVEGVTASDRTLTIRYRVRDGKPGSATFHSPLIVVVDDPAYSRVKFVENGKEVKTLSIP
jgi:hypothetical protein